MNFVEQAGAQIQNLATAIPQTAQTAVEWGLVVGTLGIGMIAAAAAISYGLKTLLG